MPLTSSTVVLATCKQNDFIIAPNSTLGTAATLAAIHIHDFRPGHEINIIAANTLEQITKISET